MQTVVARCDDGEHEFVLKQHPILDDEFLRRKNPDVAAVWDADRRALGVAFGHPWVE